MFKVIVVEDDRIIRKSIVRSDWTSIDCQIVGEASNGQDALMMVEEKQPHLVITDINMPFMDGITLAKKIREKHINIRIIFLTGYDDFEYLHEALLLKTDDYLLKPIKMTELLEKAALALSTWEKENRRNDQLMETLPLLQERFVSAMLFSKEPPTDEMIINELDRLTVRVQSKPYIILNVRIAEQSADFPLYEKLKRSDLKEDKEFLYYQTNEVFVILHCSEQDWDCKSEIFKEELKQTISDLEVTPLFITESSLHTRPSDFKRALLEAKVKMEQEVMYYNDNDDEVAVKFSLEKQSEEIERIDSFLNLLQKNTFRLTEVKKIGFNIAAYINGILNYLKPEDNEDRKQMYVIGQKIMRAADHQDLYAILDPLFNEWKEQFERQQNESQSESLIKRATAYVDSNYDDPELSLTGLADEIHVTAPYLSNLFKSELKMNFTAYLLELRMEKAKSLLSKTDLKTYQIANRVGYSNSHYFSSSFKKYTGQTPTAFRKSFI